MVPMVLKVNKEFRGFREKLDHKVFKVLLELMEQLALKVIKDYKVKSA
jgi:hypothetical protein